MSGGVGFGLLVFGGVLYVHLVRCADEGVESATEAAFFGFACHDGFRLQFFVEQFLGEFEVGLRAA